MSRANIEKALQQTRQGEAACAANSHVVHVTPELCEIAFVGMSTSPAALTPVSCTRRKMNDDDIDTSVLAVDTTQSAELQSLSLLAVDTNQSAELQSLSSCEEKMQPCSQVPILYICELAHRDVNNDEPLCLGQDFDGASVRAHIWECEKCHRWYRNSRRAYERSADVKLIRESPRPSLTRRPAVVLPAAGGPGRVMHAVQAVEGNEPLARVSVHLKWTRQRRTPEAMAAKIRHWSVVVKVPSESNEKADLERLEGSQIRLDRFGPKNEITSVETRLTFGDNGDLVSIPRLMQLRSHPDKTFEVSLNLVAYGKPPIVS